MRPSTYLRLGSGGGAALRVVLLQRLVGHLSIRMVSGGLLLDLGVGRGGNDRRRGSHDLTRERKIK